MAAMRAFAAALFVGGLALAASGCGGTARSSGPAASRAGAVAVAPRCAHPLGWQRLANRIHAPVYCPGWLPDPLVAQIGGRWNNIDSVSKDRSYLESFVWQETGPGGELHVILRGYPGRTKIPTCTTGDRDQLTVPCFADSHGVIREHGIAATMYTVNQDADTWHVALLWRHGGGIYTLSEHVAPPLSFSHVVRYLHQELRSLVLVAPTTT
jgi:hypothetical protein